MACHPERYLLIIVIPLAISLNCLAEYSKKMPLAFIENKGQIVDMDQNLRPDVLFKSQASGLDIYLTNKGITYLFVKEVYENLEPDQCRSEVVPGLSLYRMDMELIGANPNCAVIKSLPFAFYQNFYLSHCPQGIRNVKSYREVTYKDIYPNIDWVIKSDGKQLKHEFVVHPGGNPELIIWRYLGADGTKIHDNVITVSTSFGDINEAVPYSYQMTTDRGEQMVSCSFIQQNGNFAFQLADYNKNSDLIVDPYMYWSTFYGGTLHDWATGNCVDHDGNVYLTGRVNSVNFPTFDAGNGAYYEPNFGSFYDAFIQKHNNWGVLKWATYFGGDNWDLGLAMTVDASNNLILTGESGSSDMPVLDPGGGAWYQPVFAGWRDVMLAKFDPNGVMLWSTYIGDAGFESGQSIVIDDNDNFYITGYSGSDNLPVTDLGGGAWYQSSHMGGNDGFILKFNAAGALTWCTYYGGTATELGGFVAIDDGDNIYLVGETSSTDFPTLDPGGGAYFQGSNAGAEDFYIVKFNSSGVREWATYLGGAATDKGKSVTVDCMNSIFITGEVYSTDMPTVNAGGGAWYQPANAGDRDVYVARFNQVMAQTWATYYGGARDDHGYFINTDGFGHIWVTGYTWSWDFPTLNPLDGSFYDSTFTGNSSVHDVLFIKFENTGIRKWATYCGGGGDEHGHSLAPDTSGSMFAGGTTDSFNFPTAPGDSAYTDTWNQGKDNFLIKFTDSVCNIVSLFLVSATELCEGDSVFMTNLATGASSYEWLLNGNPISTDTNATALLSTSGVYTISLVGRSGCCRDTFNFDVTVYAYPNPSFGGDTIGCLDQESTLIAYGGDSYLWDNGSTDSSITVSPTSPITYYVTVSNGPCSTTASFWMDVFAPPIAEAGNDTTITWGGSAGLDGFGGLGYLWSPIENLSCFNCRNPIATPSVTTTYTVTITDAEGCTDVDSVTVFVTEVACDETNLFVPIAFTPNGDDHNDQLYVRGNGVTQFYFAVYDRWGEMVFETKDQGTGWDGTYQGRTLDPGVFAYYYKVTCYTGVEHLGKGNVTIIR